MFSLQYDIVFPNKKFRGGKTAQFQSYQEFIVSPKCAFKKENEGRRERDKDKITQNNNKESRAGHAQFLLGGLASTRKDDIFQAFRGAPIVALHQMFCT